MGKSPKSSNNVSMLCGVTQLLGVTQSFIQAHAAVLVDQRFRMHEGQIEKRPHCRVCRSIKTARQCAISGGAPLHISREGARAVTKHVARKLIKQKHQRERALYAFFPGCKLAICGCLVALEKPRSDGLVETFIPREPFIGSGTTPESDDLRGRNANSH